MYEIWKKLDIYYSNFLCKTQYTLYLNRMITQFWAISYTMHQMHDVNNSNFECDSRS